MTPSFHIENARAQAQLATSPYDRWVNSEGETQAEFHRLSGGFLLRFIGQADFAITNSCRSVSCIPVLGMEHAMLERLFDNAIIPLLTNHAGGLCLHGSAVVIHGEAVAFVGETRRGKTTLAAAIAHAGHAFLTEDMVEVSQDESGIYLKPQAPKLRLFADSARHVGGHVPDGTADDAKVAISASETLPFAREQARLRSIYVLGPGKADTPTITAMDASKALVTLLPNAFVLDIEDKPRLRGHFHRLAQLTETIPSFAFDYRREYSNLPLVIRTIEEHLESDDAA